MKNSIRIGYGFDLHRLTKGRDCIIGGVKIPFDLGLDGHSDADVLLHAISDALLGALALGDIGYHFPDTDHKYKGADSTVLLKEVYKLILEKGYEIVNLDCTVVAEKPKLAPYIHEIRTNISHYLNCEIDDVSVKATTSERIGSLGRLEGISATAAVLIAKKDS